MRPKVMGKPKVTDIWGISNLEGEKDFNDDHREEITDFVQSIPGFQECDEEDVETWMTRDAEDCGFQMQLPCNSASQSCNTRDPIFNHNFHRPPYNNSVLNSILYFDAKTAIRLLPLQQPPYVYKRLAKPKCFFPQTYMYVFPNCHAPQGGAPHSLRNAAVQEESDPVDDETDEGRGQQQQRKKQGSIRC
ncbi:uncharacterized protein TNCV_3961481 [Trichonephila clavipes]|nr:uncharacterized protein TNCV_3961481 [Trichonephila clavipes]